MTIVIATTLHAYATDQHDTSLAWLYNAEAIRDSHPEGVLFFAALETDARGLAPFKPLLNRMQSLGGEADRGDGIWDYWSFTFDDHADKITTANRLRRITTGQNLANTYADTVGASHLLFCAADCAPPPDVLPKLLEMDHPIVGPEIRTYCLSGPEPMTARVPVISERVRTLGHPTHSGIVIEPGVDLAAKTVAVRWDDGSETALRLGYLMWDDAGTVPLYPDFPVQEHMASAACILLGREVFTKLRWRTDRDAGMTDDPCLHHDAQNLLGLPTYVRKDVVAKHYPESIGAIEGRGHDMKVYR